MSREPRSLITRVAVWIIVAMLVYRVGACSCACVAHTVWFEAMHSANLVHHGCDHGHDADHSHSHSPVRLTEQMTATHCITVADVTDLWIGEPVETNFNSIDEVLVGSLTIVVNGRQHLDLATGDSAPPSWNGTLAVRAAHAVLQI